MGAALMLFNEYTKRSHSMLLSYNFKTAPFTTQISSNLTEAH